MLRGFLFTHDLTEHSEINKPGNHKENAKNPKSQLRLDRTAMLFFKYVSILLVLLHLLSLFSISLLLPFPLSVSRNSFYCQLRITLFKHSLFPLLLILLALKPSSYILNFRAIQVLLVKIFGDLRGLRA